MAKPAASSKDGVIVFVKAPVPGRVKTRLCPPLLFDQAAEIYQSFTIDTVELLKTAALPFQIAYSGSEEFPSPDWTSHHDGWFPQVGSDLGEKLTHAFQTMFERGASRVLAIGTDSPGLSIERVKEGIESLSACDVVMGPALDGGYYLIGLAKPCSKIFHGIQWSTHHVAEETRQHILQEKLTLKELLPFGDVDTYEDLKNLHNQFKANRIGPGWPRTERVLKRLFEGNNG